MQRIRALAPDGVHHVVEVAFGANIKTDTEVLALGGSIATYVTNVPTPEIPVWQLLFVNARIFFVGSDDVPVDAKTEATRDINQALEAGWQGLDIAEIVPLAQIAPMNWLSIPRNRAASSSQSPHSSSLAKSKRRQCGCVGGTDPVTPVLCAERLLLQPWPVPSDSGAEPSAFFVQSADLHLC